MVNLKLAASYLLSIIIITLIVYSINISSVFEQISKFGVAETIVGIFIVFLSYIFRAVIWKQLLSPFAKVSLKESYHVTVIGFFLNNFLPLRAGEIARAFLLNKTHPIGKLKIFSTIIVERIVEGLSLVLIFIIAMLFVKTASPELFNLMVLSTVLFVGLFLTFIFSSTSKKLLEKIFGFSRFFKEKVFFLFEELFIGEAALKKGVKENLVIWGASIIVWGVYLILYYFVAQILGIQIQSFELIVLLAISSLSTVIPSAPGYIGTFEAGFILAFAAFGLGVEAATSMAIIIHLLFLLSTTILGFISLKKLNISFGNFKNLSS